MNERSQRLHDLLVKWVEVLGMTGPIQRTPAEKAPSTLALIEHTLAEAEIEGAITGYRVEVNEALDQPKQVRITIGIPSVLDRIEVKVAKSDADIPAAGNGMSEF